jgi:hypothetical protein
MGRHEGDPDRAQMVALIVIVVLAVAAWVYVLCASL